MRCSVRKCAVSVLGILFAASFLMAAPPDKPTVLTPNSVLYSFSVTPSFTWASSGATWSQIWIQHNGQDYLSEWVQGNEWLCDQDLPAGQYNWWVRTWNSDGLSLWSDGAAFSKIKAPVVGDTLDDVGIYGRAARNYGIYGHAASGGSLRVLWSMDDS